MFSETVIEYASNPYILAGISILLAYWASAKLQPVIILLSQQKNLMDEPEARSSHVLRVPTYGGVAMFIVFSILVLSLTGFVGVPQESLNQGMSLIAAISILFFLGIKDDMVGLAPTKKFLGQLLAACLVIFIGGMRIESLDGIFGIGQLPYMVSILFSIFVYLLMVNAYNLIDGIDGLAGVIAIISTLIFGWFFLVDGNTAMAIISFVLVGTVLGFLRFNLSDTRKLFMGDSGSLFIGFLLAYQAIAFLNANQLGNSQAFVSNAPVIVLTIFSFPLLDTLRVFALRAIRGRSPFSPDRNHIHHHLIDKGMAHKQATTLIATKSLLMITVAWMLQDIAIHVHLLFMVALGFVIYLIDLAFRRRITTSPVYEIHEPKADEATTAPRQEHPPKAVVRPADQAKKRAESLRETATAGD
jgi:UDP-N-acetylmuramyl pentapeptide phosphotransferase/UDP-N-acetylglucosamine-1-phosphate transferase